MTDDEFDRALVSAAFSVIAQDGWTRFSVAAAARAGGLDLGRARQRFPGKRVVLLRFGSIADRAALSAPDVGDGLGQTAQEQLFDMLMRRFDVLQTHRAGVLALFRALPADPATTLMLGAASLASMKWMLEAAGFGAGPLGVMRAQGLLGVWLWTVKSWQADESVDLSSTMATLDSALSRAAQIARSLPGGGSLEPATAEPLPAEPDGPAPDPTAPDSAASHLPA